MLRNLKIAHQGLILVLLPVVFEIVFVLLLGLQMNKTFQVLQEVNQSRQFGAAVESVVSDIYGLTQMLQAVEHGYGSDVDKELQAVREKLVHIRQGTANLVATSSGEGMKERAEVVVGPINESTMVMSRVLAKFDKADLFQVVLVIKSQRDFLARGRDTLIDSLTGLLAARREQQEKYDVLVQQQAKSLQLLMIIVIVGGVLHVLLALFLWMMFSRDTADSFKILMDNTGRLALGQPLNPLLPGKGEIAHLDRVFQDMAQALDAARRKERAIIENAIDVICSFDQDGKFTAVSPACQSLFGYLPVELVGTSFRDLVFSKDVSSTEEMIATIRKGAGRGQFENRAQRKDGAIVDVLWAIQWSEVEQLMFCVAHDITKQKEVERMKQEFVAMVSHDLRTPLTSIQSFLTMLSAGVYGDLNANGTQTLDSAEASSARLIGLINDLLEIEKMDSGKLNMEFKDVAISELFHRSVGAVIGFAEQQHVRLVSEPNELVVFGDSDRLIQVIVNLISNAIKFSARESTVRLEAIQLTEAVEIRVIDQGRGVPAEFKDAIFERFQQVEAADATIKGGSGLGLAICKAIVEGHHGEIGVNSEEGSGSTFWFRLPLKSALIEKSEESGQNMSVSVQQL